MKWPTHQVAALGCAIALKLPPEAIIAAVIGAILPDKIDMTIAKMSPNSQKTFKLIHRGTTHWFGWWLILFLPAILFFFSPLSAPLSPFVRSIVIGLAVGGLSHVLLDMLNPSGVPIFPFSKKPSISLSLCSTGSLGEYIFLACMILIFIGFFGSELRHTIIILERMAGHFLKI